MIKFIAFKRDLRLVSFATSLAVLNLAKGFDHNVLERKTLLRSVDLDPRSAMPHWEVTATF